MADETAETRPVRMCDSCGGVDDHPRHVYATASGDAATSPEVAEKALANAGADTRLVLAQIQDDTTVMKHMDCCRADGCPDGTCNQVTRGVEDLRGEDLVQHLTSLSSATEEE